MTGPKLPIPIDFDRFRAGNVVVFAGERYVVDRMLIDEASHGEPVRIEMLMRPEPDGATAPALTVALPVPGDALTMIGEHAYQVDMWHREPGRTKLALVRAWWRDSGTS